MERGFAILLGLWIVFLAILLRLFAYSFIFVPIILASNLLLDTTFSVINYSLFCGIVIYIADMIRKIRKKIMLDKENEV